MQQTGDYKQLYEGQLAYTKQLEGRLAALILQLNQLQKMIFGTKNEQFHSNNTTSQLSLDIDAEAVATTSIIDARKVAYTRIKTETKPASVPVRMKLPEYLERRDKSYGPEQSTTGLRRLGEEVTEELEYEPGKLYVNRIIRPKKYVAADNITFLVAPMPERPLPKAIAGPGLLTQIVIDKCVDQENVIRPVAIGRKNYLFAGSHKAAGRSAMLNSLLGTCKLHDKNPFTWMKDTLQRIPGHYIHQISQLLPHNCGPRITPARYFTGGILWKMYFLNIICICRIK